MIALLQRVSEASVSIDDAVVGQITAGLCVLVGVQPHDDEHSAQKLVDKLLGYRVFPDEQGRMNLDVKQAGAQGIFNRRKACVGAKAIFRFLQQSASANTERTNRTLWR